MSNYLDNGVLERADESFSTAYKEIIFKILDENPSVMLGDADLGRALYGASYADYKKNHPAQMFDVGIQEANLVGVASGLSVVGKIPVIHSFAAFITRRTFDTLFVSGAYAHLNLKLIGTDPGITSAYNGGTHMTFEDIGLLRSIPNAVIFEPADTTALRAVLPSLIENYGICYIRMPRNIKPYSIYGTDTVPTIGKASMLRDGCDATIVALGTEVGEALIAAQELEKEGISVRVLDAVSVKPLDVEAIISAAKDTGAIVTAENHGISTGLFAAVSEALALTVPCVAEHVGIDEEFGEVGNYDELLHRFKLDSGSIAAAVRRCIARKG